MMRQLRLTRRRCREASYCAGLATSREIMGIADLAVRGTV